MALKLDHSSAYLYWPRKAFIQMSLIYISEQHCSHLNTKKFIIQLLCLWTYLKSESCNKIKKKKPLDDKHQIVEGKHHSETEIFTWLIKNYKTVGKLGEI